MNKKKLNIKKGDTVMVITGDDKNKTGRVLDIYPPKMKVLVEGVNIRKKHTRPSQIDPQGGIKEITLPIHYSNVQLVDSNGVKTRVGRSIETDKNGNVIKKRIARSLKSNRGEIQ